MASSTLFVRPLNQNRKEKEGDNYNANNFLVNNIADDDKGGAPQSCYIVYYLSRLTTMSHDQQTHDRTTCTPLLLFARVKIVFLNIARYHIGIYSM